MRIFTTREVGLWIFLLVVMENMLYILFAGRSNQYMQRDASKAISLRVKVNEAIDEGSV